MKRILCTIIAFSMLMCCLCSFFFTAYAESGEWGSNLIWNFDENGTLSLSGEGEMASKSWPRDYPWYELRQSVKKIVIGEGITSVANDSFNGCKNAEEIVLPSTLNAVYSWAFCGCDSVGTVTIPASVEFIDMMAFNGASAIKGYKYSGAEAYANYEEIEFISMGELPETVLLQGECGDDATFCLTNRNVLTISGTGATAYYEYEGSPWWNYLNRVQKIVIEEGITAVGTTFNGCISVKEIVIPEGVKSIDEMAFYGCWKLESLTLPSTLKTIGNNAFESLGLSEIVIPEGVESIGDCAFSGEIKKATIPNSVTYIGEEAFGSDSELVICGERGSYAEEWAAENGFVFKTSLTSITGTIGDSISWVLNEEGILTISGTGVIDSWNGDKYSPWYEYRDIINEVVVEDGITSLGAYSFWGNTCLSKITIPESVEYIDFYFIYNNSNTITVKGYTYSYAHSYASSRGYDFESLGYAAKKVVANGSCGENVEWTLDNYGTLTISGSGGITDSYAWWDYKYDITEVIIENGVTGICSDAFTSCSNLNVITIAPTVTYIDRWAFSGNSFTIRGYSPSDAETYAENEGYTFVSLGVAPVTEIASGKCGENLTWSLDNYGLLKIMGTGAMNFSSGTTGGNASGGTVSGVVSGSTKAQDYDVPWNNYLAKIKNVEIENGVTSIDDYAFYNCDAVEEISVPDSVVSVGECAFAYCDNLKKVTIHYNTTDIADRAFEYSNNLTVYGYEYSRVHEIAEAHSIPFESLGEAPVIEIEAGELTDTIKWSFNSYGVLNIYGTGDMPSCDGDAVMPWNKYASSIKKVEVDGVDKVTGRSLEGLSNLKEIVFNNVIEIENYAVTDSRNLETVTMMPSVEKVSQYTFGYNTSEIEFKGYKNTYAENYAEFFDATFTPLEGETEINTVYVSTVDELLNAIDSNTIIIIEDGVYLLDRSSYLGDKNYTWTYADVLRIENVINLTIKAKNPGKVEILSAQKDYINNYGYENAPLYVAGGYNLVFEGIRFGNMEMRTNNGQIVRNDGISLFGGGDDNIVEGMNGSYITSASSDSHVIPVLNKVKFSNCDIFNCAYAVEFNGISLTIENCTIRDNVIGAISSTAGKVVVTNSTFSNNGNNESYKGAHLFNVSANGSLNVSDCLFINNGNESFSSNDITESGNKFSNNSWNGEIVKAYGVTQNSITWLVTEIDGYITLKLGYSINADSLTIESETGEVYPYTNTSLPWINYGVEKVIVNEGIVYNYKPNNACGQTALWTYDENTKTLEISGKGNMTNMGYIEDFSNYDVENIVIADTITGVYNIFSGTDYTMNNDNWFSGALYIDDVLIRVDNDTVGEVVVKEGTRIIADEAFHNCNYVTSIVIPETVKSFGVMEKLNVGESASYGTFSNCSSLEKLTIPANVTAFDHAMVYRCNNLKEIYYSGGNAMWANIVVGENNDQLNNCIIYTLDADTDVEIKANASETDDKIMVEIETSGVKVSDLLILIGLDASGNNVTYDAYKADKIYTGPLTIDKNENIENIRILVWESFANMRPLAEPVVVEVNR